MRKTSSRCLAPFSPRRPRHLSPSRILPILIILPSSCILLAPETKLFCYSSQLRHLTYLCLFRPFLLSSLPPPEPSSTPTQDLEYLEPIATSRRHHLKSYVMRS